MFEENADNNQVFVKNANLDPVLEENADYNQVLEKKWILIRSLRKCESVFFLLHLFPIFLKLTFSIVFILDGCSFHVAHV